MEILLDIIVPVFGIVLIGYLAARSGVFTQDFAKGLSFFVFNFAVPPLLFRSMAIRALPETIEWTFLLAYFGGGLIAGGVGAVFAGALFRRDFDTSVMHGAASGNSNMLLLGMPLALLTFGEIATFPAFLLIAFNAPILVTVTTILIEGRRSGGDGPRKLPGRLVRSLVTNPIVMALVLGSAWNVAGWPLPDLADGLLDTLGRAALPCALFSMGASLAAYKLAGAIPQIVASSFMKLVVHPLAVWVLATWVFAIDPLWRDIAVLSAAAPAGINVYIVATRYDAGTSHAAAAMLLTTVLSVLSISVILHLLGVR